MKKTNVIIDWLSLSCHGYLTYYSKFVYKVEDYGTRMFSKITTVYYNCEEFAVCTSEPQSSIIDKDLIIIKVINKWLYDSEVLTLIKDWLEFIKVENIKLSRLDLAIDFEEFELNLQPETFIKRFVKEQYLKQGRSTFKLIGDVDEQLTFDYLSFGKKTSNINCYLYNKTKELNEVKMKPYITELWKNKEMGFKNNVWRLEFSLKNLSDTMIFKNTGELKELNYISIFDKYFLHNVYYSLVKKYFNFKIHGVDRNKSRLKDLMLFNEDYEEVVQINIHEKFDSNRLDKYLLKRLEFMFSELREKDIDLFKNIEKVKNNFMEKKNLEKYYYEKLKPRSELLQNQDYIWKNPNTEQNEIFDI